MVNEVSEMWSEYKKMKQDARTQRREKAPDQLTQAGINFTEHNNGAHLIVETHMGLVDFWPGTTRWKTRTFPAIEGFGVQKLLQYAQPEFLK